MALSKEAACNAGWHQSNKMIAVNKTRAQRRTCDMDVIPLTPQEGLMQRLYRRIAEPPEMTVIKALAICMTPMLGARL